MRTQIFVINLDRSPDRLERISGQLARAGLSFERVPGIDGRTLDLTRTDGPLARRVDRDYWGKYHHRAMLPAEVGCYLSHLNALDMFLAAGGDTALILEDDAEIPNSLGSTLAELLHRREEWDIVKLHARHPGPQIRRRRLGDHGWLTSYITDHAGATAYLLNRQAAARLKAYMLPARLPYDHLFHRSFAHGLRVRGVSPSPIRPSDLHSVIERERGYAFEARRSLLQKWADPPYSARWRVPLVRAWCELRRVWHNLFPDGGAVALLRSIVNSSQDAGQNRARVKSAPVRQEMRRHRAIAGSARSGRP